MSFEWVLEKDLSTSSGPLMRCRWSWTVCRFQLDLQVAFKTTAFINQNWSPLLPGPQIWWPLHPAGFHAPSPLLQPPMLDNPPPIRILRSKDLFERVPASRIQLADEHPNQLDNQIPNNHQRAVVIVASCCISFTFPPFHQINRQINK